ncbi:MAG: thioesterase family protein [Bacteroidota bacterium]
MFTHQTKLRVRYSETDQMGVLYHGNYAQYYEVGRVEAIRSLGTSYKQMEEEYGVMMPVMSLNMRFVRPVPYDEQLTIHTSLRALPDRYITFHIEIFNEQSKLVNGGSVRLCFLEAQSRKRCRAPEHLLSLLRPYFPEESTL